VNTKKIISPAQKVHWAVEQNCILVVNETRNEVFRLTGMEQTIWDCLVLGCSHQKVRYFIAAMGKLDLNAADQEIHAILAKWHRLNLVEIEEAALG